MTENPLKKFQSATGTKSKSGKNPLEEYRQYVSPLEKSIMTNKQKAEEASANIKGKSPTAVIGGGLVNAAKSYGKDVAAQAKSGLSYAKEGAERLYSPPDVRPEDVEETSKTLGKGAGFLEGAAQVAKAGAKGVAGLGKIVGGIGAAALSPLAPLFKKGTEIGEKLGEKVPLSVATPLENTLTKYPAIEDNAKDIMDISSLAVPRVGARGAQALSSVGEKAIDAYSAIPKGPTTRTGFIDAVKGYRDNKVKESIKTDIDSLFRLNKSLGKAANDAARQGTDLKKILSDQEIFRGIEVKENKIVPDAAIEVVRNRIEPLLEAKRKMLPIIDRLVPPTSKETLLAKAKENIAGKFLKADEELLVKRIEELVSGEGDEITVSMLDDIRAKARKGARDAKGQLKSQDEYAALETAARDIVFELTDNLPVSNAAEFKALNDYVKQMIKTEEFLEKSLRNQPVKGGTFSGYSLRLLGSLMGSQAGPIGFFGGHVAGGLVADIILNNQFGSSFKMALIRQVTDDPQVIQQAQMLLEQLESIPTFQIPEKSSYESPTQFGTSNKGSTPILQEALDVENVESGRIQQPL